MCHVCACSELAGAVQLVGVLRLLVDPESMGAVNVSCLPTVTLVLQYVLIMDVDGYSSLFSIKVYKRLIVRVVVMTENREDGIPELLLQAQHARTHCPPCVPTLSETSLLKVTLFDDLYFVGTVND